ncbi:N-acetylmuramoyl-L-alanine amidase [Bacteroidota bacterium]
MLIFLNFCLTTISYGQIEEKYSLKTIIIDAGHGGRDDGTSGRKAKEKDIALTIAIKLGTYIEENIPDVKVIYTRTTDVFVPLNERANIANKNKADLFISIHLNGNKNTRAYGTETYAMGLHKTDGNLEVAKIENSAILFEEDYTTKYEGFDPNSAESYIMFSFLQNTYLEQSLNYASFIENEFETRALRKSRGVKQAGFLVLWKTTMPSVLIEAGFFN